MIDLLNEIKTRVETLLAPEVFDDPASGQSVPMVKLGGLDPKRSGDQNAEDFPFVVIRPLAGSGSMREEATTVQLIAGLWTPDDVLAGFTAIDRMLELLLILQQERNYTPYKLALPISWQLGDKDSQHPHPYYYLTVDIPFKRAPQATTRR